MRVSPISMNSQRMNSNQVEQSQQNPSFKASIVLTAARTGGAKTVEKVVQPFNERLLPLFNKTRFQEAAAVIAAAGASSVISEPKDLQEKVNFFALAGGAGKRFEKLAHTIGDYTKINLPFRVDEDTNIHMLDFAMANGKFFIGDNVESQVATVRLGTLGEIVDHYLKGNEVKETIICCGDNVFADSAEEIMPFFVKAMNNPNTHLALVGVERTPEEVADNFGVLKVKKNDGGNTYALQGFEEKPPKEVAEAMAIDGKNIANTGLLYMSKEAMIKLLDEIKGGVNNIKKNDEEPYDFALACKYIHKQVPEWFGLDPDKASTVLCVKKWEDVGNPNAMYQFLNDVKGGTYLSNFPKEYAQKVQTAFADRVHLDAQTPYILFTPTTDVSQEKIQNATSIEGVNIVV